MNSAQNTSSVRKIFLSCVTNEFGPHREMLTKDLSLPDVKVQVQEDFVEGGHSTLEKLDEYIKGCAAVIHLIGYATGSMPAPTEVAALLKKHSDFSQRIPCLKEPLKKNPSSLSYTQWEAWLAIYHSIPCYVYQAEATTVRTPGFVEDSDQRQLQEEHWNRFCEHGKDRKIFQDEQQLCRLVLRSLSNILPSGTQKLNVMPKGLRSFDANDADFFLDLLPGPRDKDGLPESIRFWKHRIEERDEVTFTVGVIYGPSGCGKSSLMKAGLLPRLGENILPVYVEATANDTEARLLKGIRKRCPDLPNDLDLAKSIANLKDGTRLKSRQKILLVIDQFDQWLHAKRSEQNTELVQALRLCDGEHVQCVVLVRDDFWLTISRFMGELEINLQQGQNLALVDLFDQIHAHNILAAFGRGFGRLEQDLTQEQEAFLEQAVAGLSQDGRVICVRLALFAEMVKGKTWTPATWKEVGGAEGIGFTFLEETFATRSAPPQHRLHQKAAQAVLKILLPESGSDIKGNMQSHAELLEASGYASCPRDFDELVSILNGELRLITPTDPERKDRRGTSDSPKERESNSSTDLRHFEKHDRTQDDDRWYYAQDKKKVGPVSLSKLLDLVSGGKLKPTDMVLQEGAKKWRSMGEVFKKPTSQVEAGGNYYQLTHDYLVPSLRDWLTSKQKETRRGRAELLLADRAAVWNARPENRQLPSLWQWASIRSLTQKKNWTPPQRKMMGKAGRYHLVRGVVVAVLLAAVTFTGVVIRDYVVERDKANYAAGLVGRAFDANITQVLGITKEMETYRAWTDPLLKEEKEKSTKDARKQLHASLALLPVDSGQVDYLYGRMLKAESEEVVVIREALFDHKQDLTPKLWTLLENPTTDQDQRFRAACALAAFAPDDLRWKKVSEDVAAMLVIQKPFVIAQWTNALKGAGKWLIPPLADFLVDESRSVSDRGLIASIYGTYATETPNAYARLEGRLTEKSETNASVEAESALAKRQASVGVACMVMGKSEKVWPLLKHQADPTLRSYLMERLGPGGVDPKVLLVQLEDAAEVSVKRAILLSLGEFSVDRLSMAERRNHLRRLLELYQNDPDSGIHGATEWLLRQWQASDELNAIDKGLATGKVEAMRQWYVNRQGQTMMVISKPGEFWMGYGVERHRRKIGRSFAIASKEVTREQFRALTGRNPSAERDSPSPDCPATAITWYDAAEYCNKLSEKEGIDKKEWCYIPTTGGMYGPGMEMAPNYLQRTGYRLPSEAEWEFACRAGAETAYSFGEAEEILVKYGWYSQNAFGKTHPVGSLKPNDLGLYDMYGNSWEWCQNAYDPYEDKPQDDKEDDAGIIADKNSRVYRGGSWVYSAPNVRHATRNFNVPARGFGDGGFRVARTFGSVLDTKAYDGGTTLLDKAYEGGTTLLDKRDSLTDKDSGWIPVDPKGDRLLKLISGNPHKVYTLKLMKGDKLVIRLRSKDKNFDPLVALEDFKKNIIAYNDDEDYKNNVLNSKLVVTIPDDGEYRIIATCSHEAIQNKHGDFRLTVEKTK
jgi:formylglycine-generating enzyme required for sulfatase activity